MLAVLLLTIVILSGFLGPDDALENPGPVTVYVVLWLVMPFMSALMGDFYRVIAPWRVLARWFRVGQVERPEAGGRLGYWPAAAVLVAFTWWELVSPVGSTPLWLAVAAVAYTLWMLVTIGRCGGSTQLTTWDGFGAYNNLMGAIGPIGRKANGTLVRRGWLRGLPMVDERPGLDAVAVALVGGVTYDGLSGIPFWRNQLAGPLEDALWSVGLDLLWAEMVVETLGLAAAILMVGWAYHMACAVSAFLSESSTSVAQVRIRFAHTLAPIALAYAFAHYFTLILFEGQLLLITLSDPFGLGWDLLGRSESGIYYTFLSPTAVWYMQLVAVIAGHVGGAVLAHDRALADFGAMGAIRSQYPMLALMVLLTLLALFILTAG